MCGITGLYRRGGISELLPWVGRANDAARHRGPDGQGYALFDTSSSQVRGEFFESTEALPERAAQDLAFGHRRLAIIDLSDAGRQPMSLEDGRHWITYNGEVYNYLELRADLERQGHCFRTESDTEVILRAYAAWGSECVERFNGMWAFAIADLERRILFCSRDRLGIKPFHWIESEGCFAFASEIKQLLQLPFVRRQPDRQSVFDFLIFGANDHWDHSFFEGVEKLLPGHNLTLDLRTGERSIERYYDPPIEPAPPMAPAESAERFRELFIDSVRLRLRSDVEVGSCLSGGLDSSSIVCIARRLLEERDGAHRQRTFSCHFDDPVANELEYMQEVIERTSVEAHFVRPGPTDLMDDLERVVAQQEEPFGSTSIFAQWWVYELTQEHGVKVMLDGQGADEQLAGYLGLVPSWFQELELAGRRAKLAWERFRSARLQGVSLLEKLRSRRQDPASAAPIDWVRPEFRAECEASSPCLEGRSRTPFGPEHPLQNLLYQLTFLGNLQSLFKFQDRSSMAFSVEGRVPFADYRLVELLFSLPADHKIRGGYTKRVLRDAMRDILPAKIRWRVGKLGFATPERSWQSGVLRPLIAKALRDDRVREFIDPVQAEAWLSELDSSSRIDFTPWRWLSLFLWMNSHGI